MQIVCAQCVTVSEIDDESFAASDERSACSRCGARLTLPSLEAGPEVHWLVLMPDGQAGPFSAAQMAHQFDRANVDWTSLVWRHGLKGWRPARRDPQLVTSVASARGAGAWGDTQRVPRNSPLSRSDTIAESPPRIFGGVAGGAFPASAVQRSWTEDGRGPFAQVAVRARFPEPTLADAFRSAPAIIAGSTTFDGLDPPATREPPDTQPVSPRRSTRDSWLPSVQSMLLVAIVAFGFGVFVAALWGRLIGRADQRERVATVVLRPSLPQASAALPETRDPPSPARSPTAIAVTSVAPAAPLESPQDNELRRETRRVSPDVRRCVDNLGRGAEVEVFLDGASGRVRDLRLRTKGLTPGRIECITQAVRQMQVTPFRRPTYKFWHRFSY